MLVNVVSKEVQLTDTEEALVWVDDDAVCGQSFKDGS